VAEPAAAGVPGRRFGVGAADARIAAGTMLAGGAALSLLPVHPPFTCPLRAVTGIPCPLCGMTTSVVETLRFDVADALAANPAGVAAVVVAAIVLALRPRSIRVPAPLVYATLAAMWLFELLRFDVL
jgi:hypothetical protein